MAAVTGGVAQFLVVRHHRAARLDFTFFVGRRGLRKLGFERQPIFEHWIGDELFSDRFTAAFGRIFAGSHFTLGFIEFSVAADA